MMNSPTPADAEAGHGQNHCCEPGVLEEIACRTTGIEKQAAYNAEHAQELKDAQDAYAAARARYSKARRDAAPLVAKACKNLDELVDRIRCQLDGDDLECLERAFAHVVERLERCGLHIGCCCDEDCDVDDVEDCDPDDVPGRKARLECEVAEATACFHRLIAEPGDSAAPPVVPGGPSVPAAGVPAAGVPAAGVPAAGLAATGVTAGVAAGSPTASGTSTATESSGSVTAATTVTAEEPGTQTVVPLPQRVAALLAEIDAIAKALAEGSAEAIDLNAATLVAQRHLDTVWQGFGNANEYMECLCRCLTCMVKGHAAISALVRKEAVHECYRDSWKKACKRLEDETVAEVVAEYLRICSEDGCEPDDDAHHKDDDDGGEDGGNRPGHRGEGHHHNRHGRRHHDHHDHDPDGHDEDDAPDIDIEINIDHDDDDGRRPRQRPQGRQPAPPPDDDRPPRRNPRPRPKRPYTDRSGGYRAP